MQPHAFLLLLWYFQKKKKILANFPFLKITIFFFLFEGDIRVREWENREKIELKCCANKMAECLDVLGRMLSRRGVQWEVEFCNYKRASLSFVKDNVWLPSQPPQAVIPPSVIKKETHTLFSVYPLKLADNPTRTTAPPASGGTHRLSSFGGWTSSNSLFLWWRLTWEWSANLGKTSSVFCNEGPSLFYTHTHKRVINGGHESRDHDLHFWTAPHAGKCLAQK